MNGQGLTFPKTSEGRSAKPASKKQVVRKNRTHAGVKRTRINVCADFETTTTAEDCRVWAWGFALTDSPNYDDVEIGNNIESFLDRMAEFNSICYFHNLKFDGQFIIYWLLTNGFTHVVERDLYEEKTFKTIIDGMGKFYSITVKWVTGHTTEFRDSLKKLPMGVKRIANAFNLETSKGEIDYTAFRSVGHKITPEEEDYLRRDVSIIAQAMAEVIANGMSKLTVASDAMSEFKELTGSNHFAKLFPVLSDVEDLEIRRAYRGGFTYADPRHKGHKTRGGIVLDVNSLYPSVMKSQMIPYGEPIYQRGEVEPTEARPLIIFSVTFTAKLKPGFIPCIQIKGNNMFMGTEYLTEILEPTTLSVTNVDWELYNDHYNIEVLAYNGGFKFHAMAGMFDTYINKWSEIKANEVGGKREIAKLHLNSLYGKFASNPNVTGKIPVLTDGVVKLVRGEDETRDPVYTAAGVFITAYARDICIRSAQANYDTFAYADTDSLHLLRDTVPETIDVHPSRLGAWKFEYGFDAAYYIRPKAYLERRTYQINKAGERDESVAGKYENRIAGLPVHISEVLTFEDLVPGTILHGKLNPKTVPGGVILKDVPFELKLV